MSIFTFRTINISKIRKTNNLYRFIRSYDKTIDKSYDYKLDSTNNIKIIPSINTRTINPFFIEYLALISGYLEKNVYSVNLIQRRQIIYPNKPLDKLMIKYDCDYVIPELILNKCNIKSKSLSQVYTKMERKLSNIEENNILLMSGELNFVSPDINYFQSNFLNYGYRDILITKINILKT